MYNNHGALPHSIQTPTLNHPQPYGLPYNPYNISPGRSADVRYFEQRDFSIRSQTPPHRIGEMISDKRDGSVLKQEVTFATSNQAPQLYSNNPAHVSTPAPSHILNSSHTAAYLPPPSINGSINASQQDSVEEIKETATVHLEGQETKPPKKEQKEKQISPKKQKEMQNQHNPHEDHQANHEDAHGGQHGEDHKQHGSESGSGSAPSHLAHGGHGKGIGKNHSQTSLGSHASNATHGHGAHAAHGAHGAHAPPPGIFEKGLLEQKQKAQLEEQKKQPEQKLACEFFEMKSKTKDQDKAKQLQKVLKGFQVFTKEIDNNNMLVIFKFYNIPYQVMGYNPSDLNFLAQSGFICSNGITVKTVASRSYRNAQTFTIQEYFMFTGNRDGGEFELKDALFKKSLHHQYQLDTFVYLTIFLAQTGSFGKLMLK